MKMAKEKQVQTNPNKSGRRARRGPKKGAIYIPPAQQVKMKELYLIGKSISEIVRETGRDWKTVAKIVHSADMVRLADECRTKLKEAIPDILEMVLEGFKKAPNKDKLRLGIDILNKAGVFAERQIPPQTVIYDPRTLEERDMAEVNKYVVGFADNAAETHRLFEMPMPEIDAVIQKLTELKKENWNLAKLEKDTAN